MVATYVRAGAGLYTAGQGAGFIGSTVGAIVLLIVVGMIRKK